MQEKRGGDTGCRGSDQKPNTKEHREGRKASKKSFRKGGGTNAVGKERVPEGVNTPNFTTPRETGEWANLTNQGKCISPSSRLKSRGGKGQPSKETRCQVHNGTQTDGPAHQKKVKG